MKNIQQGNYNMKNKLINSGIFFWIDLGLDQGKTRIIIK
jgi:hypothetical protein